MKRIYVFLLVVLIFLVFSSSVYADYTITVDCDPTFGKVSGDIGTFTDPGMRTLTAEPKPGFLFKEWLLNGSQVSTDSILSMYINSDVSFTATFKTATYTVDVSASEGGTANKDPNEIEYSYNEAVTVVANPAQGYVFQSWVENGSTIPGAGYRYSFQVLSNRNLIANFIRQQCVISASPNDSQFGDVTGANTFSYGQTVNLTAIAKTGYHFVNWTEGSNVVSDTPNYSFTADHDRSLIANFTVNRPEQYSVSAISSDMSKGTASGTGTYLRDASVTVTATNKTGCYFVNWTEDGVEVSNSQNYTFTCEKNRILVANFAATPHYISIDAITNESNMGTTSGTGNYFEGTTVTVIASAKPGYRFTDWTENGTEVSTSALYTFTAERDRDLVANFERNLTTYYTITYRPGTDCAGTAFTDSWEAGTAYLAGQSFFKNNYTQTGWSLTQGGAKEYDLEERITLIKNLTLYPYWTKNVGTLYLTVNYSGEGKVTLNGSPVKSEPYPISELQSYTFQMTPNSEDYYVYSINFAGKYWNANVDTDKFMVSYDMMKAENRTLTIKFDSVTAPPKTGDSSNILLWSCLFGLSAAAVTTGMILKKKSKT